MGALNSREDAGGRPRERRRPRERKVRVHGESTDKEVEAPTRAVAVVAVAARPRSHVAMAAAAVAAVCLHPPSVASFYNEQLTHKERREIKIEQYLGDPSIPTAFILHRCTG